jgi:hypothetical protein
MEESKKPTDEALIAEYSAGNAAFVHYDNFSWQVGAVLVAGAFVFWGFLLDKQIGHFLIFISSLLITLLMSSWIFYTSHNRQIYLSKLHRIHEIEKILGLQQHLRCIKNKSNKNSYYRLFGFKGHVLDYFIYFISSIGAPLIGILKFGFHIIILIPIIIVLLVLTIIIIKEKSVRDHLKNF